MPQATSTEEGAPGTRVSHFTWQEVGILGVRLYSPPDQIEAVTGLDVNMVIFDCEGCMFDILKNFGDQLNQVNFEGHL